jgi:hypothetical protein
VGFVQAGEEDIEGIGDRCTAGMLLDLVYELELEKSSTVSNSCHAVNGIVVTILGLGWWPRAESNCRPSV